MHKIIDNYLPEAEFNELKANFTPKAVDTQGIINVPWVYLDEQITSNEPAHLTKVSKVDVVSKVHSWFLSHLMWSGAIQSGTLQYLIPLLAKIDPVAVSRIQANLTVQQDKKARSKFHIDYAGDNLKQSQMNTSIYYLNTTDGGTLLEDGTEIDCIANRLVTYPYKTYHSAVLCTDQSYRIVINLNYFKDIEWGNPT